MQALSPTIEVYPVHQLPILKAYADHLGLVSLMNHYVPTEMEVDAGRVVLALVLETLSGRSPLYRLEECFAQQDTAVLLGTALPPQALHDATGGRVLDRLYDFGTMRLCTACAVQAAMRFGVERRYGHFAPTSRSVWGESQDAETQALPLQVTDGDSTDKRPDLQQCILATLCVDRAVPLWGQLDDGNASEKTLHTTVLSELAHSLAHQGVPPGACIDVADAAWGTEDTLAALGEPLCITRFPATYSECGRVIAEAVARNQWEEVGGLAKTPPTQRRPGTLDQVAAAEVPVYGKPQRAVVVHSSGPAQRRQQPLARALQASMATLEATRREVAQQESACLADAEAAAAKLRTVQSAQHRLEAMGEEPPKDGPGRPSSQRPRVVKALRYGLQVTVHERSQMRARKTQETGCFVLLTTVPTAGEMAHRSGDVLPADKEQHGIEQNDGVLQDPLIVQSLLLKKPERIEAVGLV